MCDEKVDEETTIFSIEIGEGILVIRDVPAMVCTSCGNKWFDHNTMLKLEKIAEDARLRHTQIEVIKYDAA